MLKTSDDSGTQALPLRAWLSRYPYTAAAAVFFILQAVPALFRHHTEWNDVFVAASRNLVAGRDLAIGSAYLYPPFLALVSIPFTVLPQAVSQFLFYVVNFACMIFTIKGAWSLSGGGRLQGAGDKVPAREHLVFLLALFCGGRFLVNALFQMQSDLLIAALLIAGCMALHSGRSFLSATWIGLAAALKCTPVLFVPYLAWRGKWAAAAWLVIVAVGVNFLPDLAYPRPSGGSWAMVWFNRYVRPIGNKDFVPGSWYAEISGNQSLSGAVNRLFTTKLVRTEGGEKEVTARKTDLSPAALRSITLLLYALAALPCAFAMWRRKTAGPARDGPSADALEFGIIFLLMLLLSPRSSRTHFGIMILPALCIGRIALSRSSRAQWTFLILATLASLACFSSPLNPIFTEALWAGGVTAVAVLLLAGCVTGLLQTSRETGLEAGAAVSAAPGG